MELWEQLHVFPHYILLVPNWWIKLRQIAVGRQSVALVMITKCGIFGMR